MLARRPRLALGGIAALRGCLPTSCWRSIFCLTRGKRILAPGLTVCLSISPSSPFVDGRGDGARQAGGDGEAVAGVAMAMHDWAALGGEAVGRAVKPGS